jgi:hypothetical protein
MLACACALAPVRQILTALPRRDRGFKEVSSNWRDYPFLNCTVDASGVATESCSTVSFNSLADENFNHPDWEKFEAYFLVRCVAAHSPVHSP